MPILTECDVCGKKYRFPDERAGSTVVCKECGADLELPGGRSRSSGRSRGRSGKSSGAPPVVKYAAGGVAFVVSAVIAYQVVSSMFAPAQPVPHFGMPNGVGAMPVGSGLPGGDQAFPGSGTKSRFDAPVTGTTVGGSGVGNAAAGLPRSEGPRNPEAGSGFGAVVGVTKTFREKRSVRAGGAEGEFDILREPPDVLPPEFWSAEPEETVAALEYTAKKAPKIKIPMTRGASLGDIVFPVVPSRFVLVGQGGKPKDVRELWDVTANSKVAKIDGLKAETFMAALSPDGKYFAGTTDKHRSQGVGVWDTEHDEHVIDIEGVSLDANWDGLAIPRPDRLVAANFFGRGEIHLFELPTGSKVADIDLGHHGRANAAAFSPGGKHIAVVHNKDWKEVVTLFDLEDGSPVGDLALPGYDIGWWIKVVGLAFSHDGKELAAVLDGWHCSKIVIWNVEDGEIVDHMTFKEKLKDLVLGDRRIGAMPIQFFPGGQRLLAYEHGLIDRQAGAIVWQVPASSVNFPGKRFALDDSHLTVIDASGNSGFVTVYELPEEKIAKSTERIARNLARRNDYEVILVNDDEVPDQPTFVSMKTVKPGETTWTVKPDPGPQSELNSKPVALRNGPGSLREIALAGDDAPVAVALRSNKWDPFGRVMEGDRSAQQLSQFRFHATAGNESSAFSSDTGSGKDRAWVDVYDLKTGQQLREFKFRRDGDLVDVSPDGSRFLFWTADKAGRYDIYATQDGKQLASWQPYRSETTELGRLPVGAQFVAGNRVVTLSGEGRLVCWDLDAGAAAMWGADNASRPVVTPGGKYVGYSDGQAYYFVDAATGERCGRITDVGDVHAAAIDSAGMRLALLSEHNGGYYLFTVNLTDGQAAAPFPVPVLSGYLQWCDERYLLLDNARLIDTDQKVTVWAYDLAEGDHLPRGRWGRHWYVTTAGDRPVLAAARLPAPQVVGELSGKTAPLEFVLQPGGVCSLVLQANHPAIDPSALTEARNKLVEQLKNHKITVQEGAAVQLVVTAVEEVGTTEQRSYRQFGRLDSVDVSFTAKVTTVKAAFVVQGETAWEESHTVSNSSGFVTTQGNQSVDQALQDQYTGGVRSAIQNFTLPPFVFTPRSANGLGRTELTARGE